MGCRCWFSVDDASASLWALLDWAGSIEGWGMLLACCCPRAWVGGLHERVSIMERWKLGSVEVGDILVRIADHPRLEVLF